MIILILIRIQSEEDGHTSDNNDDNGFHITPLDLEDELEDIVDEEVLIDDANQRGQGPSNVNHSSRSVTALSTTCSVPLPKMQFHQSVLDETNNYLANFSGAITPTSDREEDPDFSPPTHVNEEDLSTGTVSVCANGRKYKSWTKF